MIIIHRSTMEQNWRNFYHNDGEYRAETPPWEHLQRKFWLRHQSYFCPASRSNDVFHTFGETKMFAESFRSAAIVWFVFLGGENVVIGDDW